MTKEKITFGMAFIVVLTVLFSSCGTTSRYLYFNSELPEEETAVLLIRNNILIKEFNGIPVKWGAADHLTVEERNYIVIPGGEAKILFDVFYILTRGQNSIVYFSQKDMLMNFNFEAGKEYTLAFWTVNEGNIFIPKLTLYMGVFNGYLLPEEVENPEYQGEKRTNYNSDTLIKSWVLTKYGH